MRVFNHDTWNEWVSSISQNSIVIPIKYKHKTCTFQRLDIIQILYVTSKRGLFIKNTWFPPPFEQIFLTPHIRNNSIFLFYFAENSNITPPCSQTKLYPLCYTHSLLYIVCNCNNYMQIISCSDMQKSYIRIKTTFGIRFKCEENNTKNVEWRTIKFAYSLQFSLHYVAKRLWVVKISSFEIGVSVHRGKLFDTHLLSLPRCVTFSLIAFALARSAGCYQFYYDFFLW